MFPNQPSSNPFDFLKPDEVNKPQVIYKSNRFNFILSKKVVIIVIFVLLLIGSAVYFLLNKQKISTKQGISAPPTQSFINNNPIAKVGEEIIYESDLNTELANYPPIKSIEERKIFLLQKISSDSAILQGAKADGLISNLDQTIFNSPQKSYPERMKIIEEIKNKVSSQSNRISGTIVAIWFYNSGVPGSLGYDQSKLFALEKITKLHSDVTSAKITAAQAVEAIQNDTSLSQIDLQYKTNAKYDFDVTKNQPILPFKGINDALYKLNPGQTSQVFLETEPGFDKPGFYQFGQVKEKITNSNIADFNSWLLQKQKIYETVIY